MSEYLTQNQLVAATIKLARLQKEQIDLAIKVKEAKVEIGKIAREQAAKNKAAAQHQATAKYQREVQDQ